MASKGSLRLMNEQMQDICEKMAAHEKTAQAAFYSQYKNAYMLLVTPYYNGEAAKAFKRYLEDGQINLLSGFLELSSETAREPVSPSIYSHSMRPKYQVLSRKERWTTSKKS